jgi:hypothetical protein
MCKFILGLIIGTLLTSSVVFGAEQFKAIKAGFKIFVNGNEFTPSDPALVVNGRTYLPLRAIGEALDKPVRWNEEKRQVEVGNMKYQESDKADAIVSGGLEITVLEATKKEILGYYVIHVSIENKATEQVLFEMESLAMTIQKSLPVQKIEREPNFTYMGDYKLDPSEKITTRVAYKISDTDGGNRNTNLVYKNVKIPVKF